MLTEADSRISLVHSVADELFDERLTKNYQLALQAGQDGLSACVWDDAFNKIIALERFSFQKANTTAIQMNLINASVMKSRLISYNYKKVSLGIVHSKSTLVPDALFEQDETEALLRFNHILEEDEVPMTDHLTNLGARNIFALSKSAKQHYSGLFPGLKLMHCSTPLIESVLLRDKHALRPSVVIYVRKIRMEILVTDSGKLLFYNSFKWESAEDFIYYVLFVMEQLKLNPETTVVELMGDIDKNAASFQLLYTYIRNIRFSGRPETLGFSLKFTSLPVHDYYSLFSQFITA